MAVEKGVVLVTDDLVATAIEAAGGQKLWNTLRGSTVDLSVGGPIWAMKGWPAGATFDQTITLNTVDEQIEFSPFTRPDWRMTFDADTDTVALRTLDGHAVGSTLVGHYSGHYRSFEDLLVATRRRIFRRNPDNTVNLNQPSITLDIGNVELNYANEEAHP
jgi:hypothetical protein